jgi:putative ABC transport system permease protein
VSPSVRLGLRLAVGTPGQRVRSALVVLATAVGAWVLLSTLAVGAAISATANSYSSVERERLAWSIIAAVALPVVVLATSVGRLSASVRDRRLANLRLLGLSASQTRTVAAAEAGLSALLGVVAGSLFYLATRPTLVHLSLAGHRWAQGVLTPGALGWLLVLLGLPALVAGSAVVPVRAASAAALARARRASTRRPSLWWAVPLLAGVGLCLFQLQLRSDENPGADRFVLFFAGTILSGLGIVLVAPWVVRGTADILVARAPGPVTRIVGRRLQSQPAGVVRITSALMIGLFLVTGARGVLVAFEDESQYADANTALHQAQRLTFSVSAARADAAMARARAIPGVTEVATLPWLSARVSGTLPDGSGRFVRSQAVVLVATCAQLLRLQPAVHGCTHAPMRVDDGFAYTGEVKIHEHGATVAHFPVPRNALTSPTANSWPGSLAPVEAAFVVPPDTPGIGPLIARTGRTGLVVAGPGRDLSAQLAAAHIFAESVPDYDYYDYVQGLRAILWTIASVVLGVGLLTLALGGIDRATSRRRELASLRMLGTSPSVLRRAQLLEAAIPTVVGCLLAIASGFLAGVTYLRLGDLDEPLRLPWASTLALAGVAVCAALAVAVLTVVATNVRLTPDLIRQE